MAKIGKTSNFSKALSINQVGAKSIGTSKGKRLYKLGGGVFTENQIIGSRKRFASTFGFKFK